MSFRQVKLATSLSASLLLIAIWLPLSAAADDTSTHIRTLASSCATCHGVLPGNQSVIPSLAGLDEAYFIDKMKAYQSSDKEHDVMVQHAKGLTETEIEQLATLFSQQSRGCHYNQKPSVNRLMEQ